MWLVINALAAITATAVWRAVDERGQYRLGLLGLILWGTALMVFVDRLMGYLSEGGEFLELTPGAAALGGAMVAVGLAIWAALLLHGNRKSAAPSVNARQRLRPV